MAIYESGRARWEETHMRPLEQVEAVGGIHFAERRMRIQIGKATNGDLDLNIVSLEKGIALF